MFPRSQREGETYIQRKSIEQVGTDELIDTVGELRQEIENLKTELRSFISRQGTWEDMKTIDENLRRREAECRMKENSLQTLELLFLRQQENIRGIIQGEMYAVVRKQEFGTNSEKELGPKSEEPVEQTKPVIGRKKRGNSPSPSIP
jgi:uncharacterized small protein (DUF1192 family)